MLNEFKCGLHGITAEHVLKYKIDKKNSFYVIILRYQSISKFKILLVNSGKYFPAGLSGLVVNFHFNLFL